MALVVKANSVDTKKKQSVFGSFNRRDGVRGIAPHCSPNYSSETSGGDLSLVLLDCASVGRGKTPFRFENM